MIGLYDSGVGGLSIWERILEQYPEVSTIYYADTAHNPLGEKDPNNIKHIVTEAVSYLFDQGCTLVLLPCNTATAVALRYLQQDFIPTHYPGKNILGIVRPLTETIKKLTTPMVLLATPATIQSGYYQQELKSNTNIQYLACPGLAKQIEQHQNTLASIQQLLEQVKDKSTISHIILACTHYPLVKNQIKDIALSLGFRNSLVLLDQVDITIHKLNEYIKKHPEYLMKQGNSLLHITGSDNFVANNSALFPFLNKL
jgi:glutamate racemase